MFNGYRNIQNAIALKSLLKNVDMPKEKLAIADDDEMQNIPLLIFKNQSPSPVAPVIPKPQQLSYEETAVKGANDKLSLDDFVTNQFTLGDPFDNVV